MLILYTTLLVSALCSPLLAEDPLEAESSRLSVTKLKRGLVNAEPNIPQEKKFYHSRGVNIAPNYQQLRQENYKPVSYNYGHESNLQKQPHFKAPISGGFYGPTYSPQIQSGKKFTAASEDLLFTMPEDTKPITESTNSPKEIRTFSIQGTFPHQRSNSHSPSHPSSNRNKPLTQSAHSLGISSYIDGTVGEEAYRNFPTPSFQVPASKTTYPRAEHSSTFQTSARAHNSPAKLIQSGAYNQAAVENINGKKVPVLQVESGEQLPTYSASIESQPLVPSSSIGYQAPQNVRYSFGGGATKPSATVQLSTPFLTPVSAFQAQVVPIQTASSTPQFPQYRGARVEAYPVISPFSKTPSSYQALQAQPHLHFAAGPHAQPVQPANTQTATRTYGPSERIRSDVEIIDKEKPAKLPPSNDDDGDKGVDNDYDVVNKQYGGYSSQEQKENFNKSPSIQGDFKPSKSYPFKQYDDTFGRYTKASSEETNDKPSSKYTSYSSGEEEEGDSSKLQKYSSGESSSYKSPYSKYGKEEKSGEEEESQNNGSHSNLEKKIEYNYKPKSYEYPSKNFEQDFEESYRKGPNYSAYNS